MALTSTNFIAGRMNKSVDERLVPPGEYIDALNVRLGSTENTEIGAVENSRGNTLLTQLEFNGVPLQGEVRCIGVYEDGINETLYWFVHNENNPNSVTTGVVDMIVSYNTNLGALTYHVISTSVLNFDFNYLITGVDKIENLLFFTDDLNPPRCINVKSDYDYPGPGAIDDVFEEEDVSVIVKPPGFEDFDPTAGQIAPLGSPFIELVKVPGEENYMETRFLSFAYRYRYEDGEYSATSLFTTPAFQPLPFALSIQNFWNDGMENRFNGVNVTVSTGTRRVKEVQILYKQTTSNVIYVIKRYNKSDLGISDNDFMTIQFTNSEIYTTLGSDELLRLYDNVPRTAKAQTIQGNRLMYGNYVDGYNIEDKNGQKLPIVYHADPISGEIAGTILPDGVASNGSYTFGPNANEPNSIITFDLTDAQPANNAPVAAGTIFNFSVALQQTTNTFCTNSGGANFCLNIPTNLEASPFVLTFNFVCPIDYNTVNDMLNSQEFKNRIGGSAAQGYTGTGIIQELYPCYNSGSGGTLSDKFFNYLMNPITTSDLRLVDAGITGPVCNSASLDSVPFPAICATSVLFAGVTDSATATANELTADPAVDFTTIVPAITVGDIVIDVGTGLTASITNIPGLTTGTNNTLEIADINGGLATLETAGVAFQIIPQGGSPAPCNPDGFEYTVAGNTFSLQVPATQYFQASGDPATPGVFSNAFRYYNFIAFSSTAQFALSPKSGSLHSNRDYEVGIVYMDEYGRASTVLTSQNNTVYFEPYTSVNKNKIKVTLSSLPPVWAHKYKFVVKPSQGTYNTVYSNLFYVQDGTATGATGLPVATANDPSQVWFKLDGQNQNILKVGDELLVKQDTQGPVLTGAKSVVLAIQAYSGGGIISQAGGGSATSLPGLYMLLKPSGWSIEQIENATIFYGNRSRANTSNGNIGPSCIDNYPLQDPSTGQPYDIPVGSTIRIQLHNWRGGTNCSRNINYDRSFVASASYPNFHAWAVGDDLQSQMTTGSAGTSNVDNMTLSFDPTLYTSSGAACAGSEYAVKCSVRVTPSGQMFFVNNGALTECFEANYNDTGYFPGRSNLRIEVTRTGGVFVFETIPQDADPNLFYDASDLLDLEADPADPLGQKYHMAKRIFTSNSTPYALAAGSSDQTAAGAPLVTELDAMNCYTFGNGVESYQIHDSPAGKGFNLGERTLAVSNQDFQEADRFAGMTYSGVFSSSANSNNLNEFNLGLVNFKDLETSFGPIMKMHSRETDILILQEDRISYVLASKNVVTDSTGGGAITSVPEVLGTQVARIEEYGISFNPESFASYGYDMFFTDTKRGAVLNLRGASKGSDQLQVVSSYGMNSWFRDAFNAQLTTQKLGGYDPYMKEYVLGTNLIQVPTPLDIVPCGTTISQLNTTQSITYDVELGLVVGAVDVNYNIQLGGSVLIQVEWNGATVINSTVTGSGTLSFNKTANFPETATITLTPQGSTTYDITVECPPEIPLTVRQVVVNSNNYAGEFIHTNYNWTDGVTISPFAGLSSAELITTPAASEYVSNSGIRSVGVFPYSGADIKLRTEKFGIDTFDFIPTVHKFRILSSNTDYQNNPTDIANLLLAAPVVSGPITSPSSDVYQAIETNFNMPLGNEFLYLIWDLRLISNAAVCYCTLPSSAEEVCCECQVDCDTLYLGPKTDSVSQVCTTDVTDPGALGEVSFNGNGGLATIGNVIFQDLACNLSGAGVILPGFYIQSGSPTGSIPKLWIQVNNNGVVINSGTC